MLNIGSRLEPFVDDYLIDRMDNVGLMLQHPVRRDISLLFDTDWEDHASGYVTVLHDGSAYRMYYRASHDPTGGREFTCVAHSTDGITWTRPRLGIFDYRGSKDNNIVWVGPGAHAFAPFKDPNPHAKPDEAYKAVGPTDGSNRGVLLGFVSPDGYHWRRIQEEPIITKGNFDSHNLAFWDTNRSEYVCYFRVLREGYRDIMRALSPDFIHWSDPELLDYQGAPREQLYTNAITQYFRAPHIYLGFPKRYLYHRKDLGGDGVSDGVIMTSRDGISFHRWLEAFMRPGPDPDNWLDRNNMAAWGIHELTPGEISIYYLAHNYRPTQHVCRATVRTDGFVSVHAGGRTGKLVTKPFVFDGTQLVINFSTSAAGGVRVELQDERGAPIPNYSMEDCPVIYGDEIERVVRWYRGSDVSSLSGRPVRLAFEMSDADLYSIRFLTHQ